MPGALLTYKAKPRTGDYHSEMDAGTFGKWVEDLLLPNLDQPCAIVMDNASYHSVKTDRAPTSSTRKADINITCNIHLHVLNEPIILDEVLRSIANLSVGKGSGIDGIPADFLRQHWMI